VKGIYEHAQLSVDMCLVAERDPASGRRCLAERRPRVGVGAEAKNYTTRARERERTPPSRCRLGRQRLDFTLTEIARKFVRIRNILRAPTLPFGKFGILSRVPAHPGAWGISFLRHIERSLGFPLPSLKFPSAATAEWLNKGPASNGCRALVHDRIR